MTRRVRESLVRICAEFVRCAIEVFGRGYLAAPRRGGFGCLSPLPPGSNGGTSQGKRRGGRHRKPLRRAVSGGVAVTFRHRFDTVGGAENMRKAQFFPCNR